MLTHTRTHKHTLHGSTVEILALWLHVHSVCVCVWRRTGVFTGA